MLVPKLALIIALFVVVLIYVFLVTDNVEHLFLGLLGSNYFVEMCVQILPHLKKI